MDKGPIIFALLTLAFIAGASKSKSYKEFVQEQQAAKLKARRKEKEFSALEQMIANLPEELREKAKAELDKLKE